MPRAGVQRQPRGDLFILYPDPPLPALPLVVTEVGASHWRGDGTYARSASRILAVELVLAGMVHLEQDGRRVEVGPGQAFLLKRGSDHRYSAVGGAVRKRFVGFDGPFAQQLIGLLPDRVAPRDPRALERLIGRIEALFRNRRPGWQLDAAALGYRLLAELGAAGAGRTPAPPTQHPALIEALRLIHTRALQPCPVAWLARQTGTSSTHLTRLFRQALGVPPQRYAQRCLIDQARFLLSGSDLTCQEVATRLGFADPLYFSAVFKRHVGESPQAYRKRTRG